MGSPHLLTGPAVSAARHDAHRRPPPPDVRAAVEDAVWTVSACWLLTLACLTGWALLPLALGWRPVLVSTGSMSPALAPGDVLLVSRELPAGIVGHIVLVDPAAPGAAGLLHRAVGTGPGGTVVTKGDANRETDAEPVPRHRLAGIGRLVVPAAGRLLLAVRRHAAEDLPWLASVAAAALALAATPSSGTPAPAPRPAPVPSPQAATPPTRRRGSHAT